MTLKDRKTVRFFLSLGLLLLTLASLWLNPTSALAWVDFPAQPSLAEFSRSVQNGQKDVLRGVYVEKVLALPIIQQPASNAGYVSNNDGEATQFGMAAKYGNIGLLAHNHLAGKAFPQLAVGQEVHLIYGNGRIETFVITEVLKYQALQPTSPYSSFKNINKEETLTAEQMFKRVYLGDPHVTFQTCIASNGDQSWGRLFVIAIPKAETPTRYDRLDK